MRCEVEVCLCEGGIKVGCSSVESSSTPLITRSDCRTIFVEGVARDCSFGAVGDVEVLAHLEGGLFQDLFYLLVTGFGWNCGFYNYEVAFSQVRDDHLTG